VLPPWPITIDAAGHAVHARHRDALRATLLGGAVQHCAGVQQVYVETVTRPRALTAERSDRALRRRVAAVTRPDAELHPGSAGRTAPLLEALT
jgi:hypothetical protein